MAAKRVQYTLIALACTLSACTTVRTCPPPEVRVERVPAPPVIELPTRTYLEDGAPESEIVRAVMEHILVLEARLKAALAALDVYRRAHDSPSN